jgi:predicted metal-binding protein
MDDRELMQMALEELEELADVGYGSKTVLQSLRERLAQQEPEPVAWMKVWRDGTKNFYDHEPPMFGKHETYALYTAPTTCQENRQVAKSATTDWEAVAADQAMTIAMMKMEQKREWVDIQYVSQHDSPVEYNIAEAVAWAVGYNQAIDNIKERNT